MFELKWQNTFTNFSSPVELTATRFQVVRRPGNRMLSITFRGRSETTESEGIYPRENCARKERGIFVQFVFCIFEEVNFICTAKCSILNEKKWMQLNDLTNHHEETFFVFTNFV